MSEGKQEVKTKMEEIITECKQSSIPIFFIILFLASTITFLILWLMNKKKGGCPSGQECRSSTECPKDKECCPEGKTCQSKTLTNSIFVTGYNYSNDKSKPLPSKQDQEGTLVDCYTYCKSDPNCLGFAIEGQSYNTKLNEQPLKVKCHFKNTFDDKFKAITTPDQIFFGLPK